MKFLIHISSVTDAMDSLEDRVKTLFSNAKKLKPEQRDSEFENIRQVGVTFLLRNRSFNINVNSNAVTSRYFIVAAQGFV